MKIGKKTIVLMGLPLGIGVAAAVVVLVILKPFGGAPPAIPDPGPGEHGVMLPLDTKVVNLSPGGDYKYAKVGVTVELRPATAAFYTMATADREAAAALVVKDMTDIMPVLDDAVATVVSAKTSSQLDTADGRAQLKQELLEALRAVLDGTPAAAASAAPAASTAPAASGAPAGSPAAATPAPAASPVVAAGPSEVIDLYFTDLVMQ